MELQTKAQEGFKAVIEPLVNSIKRMCKHANFSQSRYPYFPLTYSLWRKDKYSELLETIPEISRFEATIEFHEAFDYALLDEFSKAVEQAIYDCLAELQTPESLKLKQIIDQGDEDKLIEEYCRAAARQLTYIEKLSDLTSIPYNVTIKEHLHLRNQFKTNPNEQTGFRISSLVEKHGQTVAFKGLGKLGTSLIGKLAIGVTSMIGGVNVVGLAGGFAISKLFDVANDKLQIKKIVEKFRQQISVFEQNTKFLAQRYELCRKLLSQFVRCDSKADRKIIKESYRSIIKEIFWYDCEQAIIVTEVENNWKVVEIDDTEDDFEVVQEL